jgi:hypothetical protein
MNTGQHESDGATRLAYILGVPLAEDVGRWPQMGEIVRTSQLVADIESTFPELTLAVGRRLYQSATRRRTSRPGHRLLGRSHFDTGMAPVADRPA